MDLLCMYIIMKKTTVRSSHNQSTIDLTKVWPKIGDYPLIDSSGEILKHY